MKPIPVNQTPAWQHLTRQAQHTLSEFSLIRSFEQNPKRYDDFTFEAPEILVDLSKQHIDNNILASLIALAKTCQLESKRDAMLQGGTANITENRQVLHTALRSNQPDSPYYNEVQHTLHAFLDFAQQVRADKNITDIVNIGIGGSDLGPRMAVQALTPFTQQDKRYHFVSNVDGFELASVLQQLNPQTTLFIIVSKTFTTQETLANAHSAKKWFELHGGQDIDKHFIGVTTNIEAAHHFGITQTFGFWDWVGGRYSVWSAVGLSLAIAIGRTNFEAFLAGGRRIDEHFASTPLENNVPILLGLIDIWNRNFLHRTSRCVAPYHQGLARFPAYLQQLEMESNGKSVNIAGRQLPYSTAMTVWGEAGTNGQHAFFQMLHQGTDIIPVDFILAQKAQLPPLNKNSPALTKMLEQQHVTLLMNGLAQSRALMIGKPYQQALKELDTRSHNTMNIDTSALAHHRTFPGNRPSTTMLIERLTPQALGALIALHEHRTFTCGAIWDIDSFDQWGVELGKTLAKDLIAVYNNPDQDNNNMQNSLDASTAGLLKRIRQ